MDKYVTNALGGATIWRNKLYIFSFKNGRKEQVKFWICKTWVKDRADVRTLKMGRSQCRDKIRKVIFDRPPTYTHKNSKIQRLTSILSKTTIDREAKFLRRLNSLHIHLYFHRDTRKRQLLLSSHHGWRCNPRYTVCDFKSFKVYFQGLW